MGARKPSPPGMSLWQKQQTFRPFLWSSRQRLEQNCFMLDPKRTQYLPMEAGTTFLAQVTQWRYCCWCRPRQFSSQNCMVSQTTWAKSLGLGLQQCSQADSSAPAAAEAEAEEAGPSFTLPPLLLRSAKLARRRVGRFPWNRTEQNG